MNIKAVCEALGITQATFAQKIGVSTQTLHNWMTGKSEPTSTSLKRMSLIFGISPEWLVHERGEIIDKKKPKEKGYIENEEELIRQIVITIESKLQKEDKELPPDIKASLIANLFMECKSLVGKEVEEKVVSILKYIA